MKNQKRKTRETSISARYLAGMMTVLLLISFLISSCQGNETTVQEETTAIATTGTRKLSDTVSEQDDGAEIENTESRPNDETTEISETAEDESGNPTEDTKPSKAEITTVQSQTEAKVTTAKRDSETTGKNKNTEAMTTSAVMTQQREPVTTTSAVTASQPKAETETTAPATTTAKETESTKPQGEEKASKGLVFKANTGKNKGTCKLTGLGTCTDSTIIIPSYSPDGDKVVEIADNALIALKYFPDKIVIPDTVEKIGGRLFPLNTWDFNREFVLEFSASVTQIDISAFTSMPRGLTIHVIFHGTEQEYRNLKIGSFYLGGDTVFSIVEHSYIIEGNNFEYRYQMLANGNRVDEK